MVGKKFRTYLTKNNTIIKENGLNFGKNPVLELSYGGEDATFSRFLVSVDLSEINNNIQSLSKTFNTDDIKHYLRLTNTIRYVDTSSINDYDEIDRISNGRILVYVSFVNWDEGNGYSINYNAPKTPEYGSNWFYSKNKTVWDFQNLAGFDYYKSVDIVNGNEDINIDITDMIERYYSITNPVNITFLFKFEDEYEQAITKKRNVIFFHGRHSNTFYKPFVETIFENSVIYDDRDSFSSTIGNHIYTYISKPSKLKEGEKVLIKNRDDFKLIEIEYEDIVDCGDGFYSVYINPKLYSEEIFIDNTILYDHWELNDSIIKGRIINRDSQKINDNSTINLDNFHLTVTGIKHGENIEVGVKKYIQIDMREIYNSHVKPRVLFDIVVMSDNDEYITIYDKTLANKYKGKYFIILDTFWMLEKKYYIRFFLENPINESEMLYKTIPFFIKK